MTAGRLLRREGPPGRWSGRVLVGSGVITAIGAALTLTTTGGIAPPLIACVASLVAIGMICVRWLMPAVAVAVFGVALGCAALTTVLAVTSGFEEELTARMTRMNGHLLLTKYGLDFSEYPALAEELRGDSRVRAASPFAFSMAAIVPIRADAAGGAAPVSSTRGPAITVVKGIDPAAVAGMRGLREVLGSRSLAALRAGDVRHVPGIALGHRLAARLKVGLGDSVSLVIPAELDGQAETRGRPPRHARFEVLDLIDTGVTELDGGLALIHLSAAQAIFFGKARVTGIEVELADPDAAPMIAAELEGRLPPVFRATTWQQQSAATLAGLRQIRAAVSVVLGLLEVVAASALVASLLLLVRRKQAAIATLMAMGADSRLMFWIFEAVGGLAGVVGAAVGVGLGAAYAGLIAAFRYPLEGEVYPIDHLPVSLGAWDLLGPALAAVIICAAVSGPVALLAAQVPVLRGLGRA
jgi:lipoprotein-releasing system permease protein